MKKQRFGKKLLTLALGAALAAGLALGLTACGNDSQPADTTDQTVAAQANGDGNGGSYTTGVVSTQEKGGRGDGSCDVVKVHTKGVKPRGQKSQSGSDVQSGVDLTGIDPEKPMIALTFDDGPGEGTEKILQVLQENDSKATFFALGISIENYPELCKKLADAGMQLCSHSYNHADFTTLSNDDIQSQLKKTEDAMKQAAGIGPNMVRLPYGSVNDSVKAQLPYAAIMWNVDSMDWSSRDADAICSAVESAEISDGDIILMHDIYDSTAEAVARLVPRLKAEGFQLVTVEQMFAAKGIELKKGNVYFSTYNHG